MFADDAEECTEELLFSHLVRETFRVSVSS